MLFLAQIIKKQTMKKTIISIFCLLSFSVLTAQNDVGVFKQSSGDKSLELQFDPRAIFNSNFGNQVFSNGIGVRFRLFPSESLAYRLNVNINYLNTSEITQDADDNTGASELKEKFTSTGIVLRPGIEKHFAGTKRLSPYIGAELILGFQSSNFKEETQNLPGDPVYLMETKNSFGNDGISLGAAAVAGADFYIARKLYLGLELSYGVNYFMASKIKITSDEPGFVETDSKIGKSNVLSFRPDAMGVLRIGFLFGGGSSTSPVSTDDF